MRLFVHLVEYNWKNLLTNSKVNFIAYHLVDRKRQNDPTISFEYMSQYLI